MRDCHHLFIYIKTENITKCNVTTCTFFIIVFLPSVILEKKSEKDIHMYIDIYTYIHTKMACRLSQKNNTGILISSIAIRPTVDQTIQTDMVRRSVCLLSPPQNKLNFHSLSSTNSTQNSFYSPSQLDLGRFTLNRMSLKNQKGKKTTHLLLLQCNSRHEFTSCQSFTLSQTNWLVLLEGSPQKYYVFTSEKHAHSKNMQPSNLKKTSPRFFNRLKRWQLTLLCIVSKLLAPFLKKPFLLLFPECALGYSTLHCVILILLFSYSLSAQKKSSKQFS